MMKNKQNKTNNHIDWLSVIICAVPIFFFMLINMFCFDTYYDLNDDVTIKDMLSGIFTGTPDAHVVYMKYPLTIILALMYRVLPNVSWLDLFELACLAFSCFVISYSIVKLTNKRYLQIFLSLAMSFIFQALLIYQSIFVQYTVVSGVLAVAGMVSLFFSKDYEEGSGNGNIITGIVLFALSFCVRDSMFLFVSPFILASVLIKFFLQKGEKKESIKRAIPFIISFVIVMIAIVGMDKLAYSSKAWREYKEFNDYRTTLFDYQKDAPWYMFHPEIYDEMGFSESEAQVLVDTNLMFTDRIDTSILKRVVAYNKVTLGKGYFAVGFKDALTFYLYTLHKTRECKYCYLIIGMYLFLMIVSIVRKRYVYIPIALSIFVIKSIDWMYLIMRGRIKDRVTVPLCFCEIILLLCLIIKLGYEEKRAFVLIAIVCLALTMFYPMFRRNLKDTNEEMALRIEKDKGWAEFRDYCDSHYENFYFMDLISNITFSEKIFVNDDVKYSNYTLCGGWLSKSPSYERKLSVRNITDVDEAILNRDDVYFISMDFRDTNWLSGYYNDRGYDVSCDEVDRIYINDLQYYVVYGVNIR